MKFIPKDPIAVLQEQGYRLTPQRMMVVEAVRDCAGHATADDICTRVKSKYPYANISTIYRTLELLNKLGLVTETDLGGGRLSYHFADHGRHHHLICQKCGLTIDTADSDLSPLVEQLRKKYGFRADLRHLAIFGHCSECAHQGD